MSGYIEAQWDTNFEADPFVLRLIAEKNKEVENWGRECEAREYGETRPDSYEALTDYPVPTAPSVPQASVSSWLRVAPQPPQQRTAPRVASTHQEDWDWIEDRVLNATGTFHSYTGEPGGGLEKGRKDPDEDDHGKVYELLPDGSYRWMAFKQKSHSRLKRCGKNLDKMVKDCGGNPKDFRNYDEMAAYVLYWEQPLGVVREKDKMETYTMSQYVVSPRRIATEWFAGKFEDGVFALEPSTRSTVLDPAP